jgi:hypothetical protein
MHLFKHGIAILVATLLASAASFVAPAAIGCGFHPSLEVELENMYPGSLPVAVALRKAADRGVIDAAALEAPSKGTALYVDTVRRLQDFTKTLTASLATAELPSSFSLGYVESGLWARFAQTNGRIRIEIHTNGPAAGEAVVLTGEPVVADLLAGRLSVDRALADGIILIEGNESEKSAIRHALLATSEGDRISKSDPPDHQRQQESRRNEIQSSFFVPHGDHGARSAGDGRGFRQTR